MVNLATEEHRHARVNAVWGAPLPTEASKQWSVYPLSHPIVRAAMNRRMTGDEDRGPYDHLKSELIRWGIKLPVARAASLCCGTGALDRGLAKMGIIENCIGYDLANAALESARKEACAEGFSALTYEQRDLEHHGLGISGLELVLVHQGIHHIEKLEAVFDAVNDALIPGGLFHLHEFVGADRFQWPDRQIEEMTAWLQSLPERYQITTNGLVKKYVGRATIQEMIAYDPSEAVRSSAIVGLLAKRFDVIEHRELGGTLAMMALADIAHNFKPDEPEDAAHIERLLNREAELMGELGSDFVVITAKKRLALSRDAIRPRLSHAARRALNRVKGALGISQKV